MTRGGRRVCQGRFRGSIDRISLARSVTAGILVNRDRIISTALHKVVTRAANRANILGRSRDESKRIELVGTEALVPLGGGVFGAGAHIDGAATFGVEIALPDEADRVGLGGEKVVDGLLGVGFDDLEAAEVFPVIGAWALGGPGSAGGGAGWGGGCAGTLVAVAGGHDGQGEKGGDDLGGLHVERDKGLFRKLKRKN